MVTGATEFGVNVTLQVPELSVHEFVLNEPDPPGTLNDTVPVGTRPVTETVTVVGFPTLTVDGESVTVVVVGNLITVRVAVPELGALFVSPP